MQTKTIILILLVSIIILACAKSNSQVSTTKEPIQLSSIQPNNPAQQAWKAIDKGALVIDVRTAEEFSTGHLAGAINIPHDQVYKRLAEINSSKQGAVVVYCKSGRRAGLAKEILEQNGFKQVINGGGYTDLTAVR